MTTDTPDPTVLFVCGFHRSGTTLAASAATTATKGVTLTAGYLARHIPALDAFLRTPHAFPPDRGVDGLPVDESTPEEYGWLMYRASGHADFRPELVGPDMLRDLARDLAVGSGAATVVLKNPWDVGHERVLLDHVPGARILLVRRAVAAIEDSARRAMARTAGSPAYLRALMDDDENVDKLLAALAVPWQRRALRLVSRWRRRFDAVRLAHSVRRLPLDRVAFVSYEELRADPVTGAAWAAHILDATAFGVAFTEGAFQDRVREVRGSWVTRLIDAYWARAWRRARAAQVAAGQLGPPRRR